MSEPVALYHIQETIGTESWRTPSGRSVTRPPTVCRTAASPQSSLLSSSWSSCWWPSLSSSMWWWPSWWNIWRSLINRSQLWNNDLCLDINDNFQVKFQDLFLVQCFKLCFLEIKEKVLNSFGRNLKRKERRQKSDLTHKIETYFDWLKHDFIISIL